MANSTNILNQIVVAQAQPAVPANELFASMSPSALFSRNESASSLLTWAYYGGTYKGLDIVNGTLALTASQANIYIVASKATGVVSFSTATTNWNNTGSYDRLYRVTTSATAATVWEDKREMIGNTTTSTFVSLTDGPGGFTGNSLKVVRVNTGETALEYTTVGASLTSENVEDIVGALLVAGSGISLFYDDAASPPTLTITNTASTGFTSEQIEDIVGALVVAGSNVTVTYDDAASPPTLTIASTGGGGGGGVTQEEIEDIVGALVIAGSGITATYDDASSPATLTIASTGSSTSPTDIYEARIWRCEASQVGTTTERFGTTFGTTGTGTPALGTYSTASPQQAATRCVFSNTTTSSRLGIWDANYSHQYNTTADSFNWTAKFWFGTDAAIDTRTGVFVGLYDLNVMNSTPSTSLTNMIGMGADGGASGDTNWQIIRRAASGSATKVDTGVARAVNQYFRLTIKCVSGTGLTVTVEQYSTLSTGFATVYGPTTYTTVLPASAATPNMGASCQRCTHSTTNTDSISFMNYISTVQLPT